MADTPEFSGPPITINNDDGSSKIYDTGLLSPEARQAVDMMAFINRLRQVLKHLIPDLNQYSQST